jgi:hypothetical protein
VLFEVRGTGRLFFGMSEIGDEGERMIVPAW